MKTAMLQAVSKIVESCENTTKLKTDNEETLDGDKYTVREVSHLQMLYVLRFLLRPLNQLLPAVQLGKNSVLNSR